MSVFEVRGGNDRRSMIKRYERKSKQDAIRALLAERDALNAENERLREVLDELLEALQAIVDEVSDGRIPYSSDSYLPAHLVEQARAAIAALAARPAASAEPREVDMDEYRAMVAAMVQIDPATLPGLTAAQRRALSRFAKPAGGLAGNAQPVAWVAAGTIRSPHPRCVSSLAYIPQIDKDLGREYVPLYAAPVPTQQAEPAPAQDEREAVHQQRGKDVEAVLRLFLSGDGFISAYDIPHIVAALAAQKFVATFRCERNDIVGTTNAPIHSVNMRDDGVVEVVIDHWPEQDAEVEALRAEVAEWKRVAAAQAELHGEAEARAERMAEAINAYKSEWDNPVKDYLLRAKRRDEMFALLRDQEEGK